MAEAATHVYTGRRSSAVTVTVCKLHETQLNMATDQWLCDIYRTWIPICMKCMCTIYTPTILTHNVVNQRSDGNILRQWKAVPWTASISSMDCCSSPSCIFRSTNLQLPRYSIHTYLLVATTMWKTSLKSHALSGLLFTKGVGRECNSRQQGRKHCNPLLS